MTTTTDVFHEFIGNPDAVTRLRVELEGAYRMGVPVKTMLFTGPGGTGKTMLAETIAKYLSERAGEKYRFVRINCGSLTASDTFESYILARVHSQPSYGSDRFDMEAEPTVILWDESHRVPTSLQNEALMPVLDRTFTTRDGQRLNLRKVIHLFATTNPEKMVQPLKDRCEVQIHLRAYTTPEIARIVSQVKVEDSGSWWTIELDPTLCAMIADVSRNIPRIAQNLARGFYTFLRSQTNSLDEALDLADERGRELLGQFLRMNGIYWKGLTRQDFEYLFVLADASKPTGLPTLMSSMGCDKKTIEETIEPHLRALKLVNATRAGRALTPQGHYIVRQARAAQKGA